LPAVTGDIIVVLAEGGADAVLADLQELLGPTSWRASRGLPGRTALHHDPVRDRVRKPAYPS